MKILIQTLATVIGLTAGNFLFQLFAENDFSVAMDRSVFQAIAVFSYVLLFRETGKEKS